jgi:hypothetical protein
MAFYATTIFKEVFSVSQNKLFQKTNHHFHSKTRRNILQCWDRYRDLLNTCPHHGFETWRLVSQFYEGLTPKDRQMVELMCNETFEDKDPDEAMEYLDLLVENAQN